MTKALIIGFLLCFILSGAASEKGINHEVLSDTREPIIEIIPANGQLSVLVGEKGSLWCKVKHGSPQPTVKWQKYPYDRIIHEGQELKFDPVKQTDDGGYKCFASNGISSTEKYFNINVYKYVKAEGFTGESTTVVNYQGLNGVKLIWYNTNVMPGASPDEEHLVADWVVGSNSHSIYQPGYELDTKTGDLLITNLTLGNEGWYTAWMTDKMGGGYDYHYTKLLVYVGPRDTVIEGVNGPFNESVVHNISCLVPRVKPKDVTFKWYMDHATIEGDMRTVENPNDDGTWKVVSSLTYGFSRDAKLLSCYVGHGVDPKMEAFTSESVEVYYPYRMSTEASDPTKLPTRGIDFSLTCRTTEPGNPNSGQYFWYKDGDYDQPLKDGDKYAGAATSEMTTKHLEKDDDGIYECKLLNDGGMSKTDKSYMLKVVESKPTYAVTVKPRQSIVHERDSVKMFCSIELDNMKDALRWRLKGNIIYQTYPEDYPYDTEKYDVHSKGPSNVTIVVKNLKKSDEGPYRCEAIANPAAFNLSEIVIIDEPEPSFEVEVIPRQTISELGTSPTIRCIVDLGKNNDSIRWKRVDEYGVSETIFQTYPTDFIYDKDKYGISLPKSGTVDLTIKNIIDQDGGKYICEPIIHVDKGKVANLVIKL